MVRLYVGEKLTNPAKVIECFSRYMAHEKQRATRAQFEKNLHAKATDSAFLDDLPPLLAEGVGYDASAALQRIHEAFIQHLPGKPWKGTEA